MKYREFIYEVVMNITIAADMLARVLITVLLLTLFRKSWSLHFIGAMLIIWCMSYPVRMILNRNR